ncbi:hypothetical protein C1752_01741 [Acaryochloris thomasi RCC1774]|uniref:Ferritin-like domain-containing protein n=1 Tax=Acaryochloris thomasi RCC1774 TaxID=1764569 RepID=A0A2W1JK80_9CYAN|nr:ferritin-like domain-containing protein [Acaryochloris thomasi]PZD73820.1 hypothetical protein C1752_01741 [Acaryochloris thomasi RCC1774]
MTDAISLGRTATCGRGKPYLKQMRQRIGVLVDQYLAEEMLCDRIQNLPQQFQNPQPRKWGTIDWQGIDPEQIIGIDPLIFIAILAGCIDTELPIRGYTQTSRQYLENLCPPMAKFVGGEVDNHGNLIDLGLWEKEERQHAPTLQKIYTQLTGLKLRPIPHEPRPYQSTGDIYSDLYIHGLHRVATEYGAACLYLWLMAHSTGPLQVAIAEMLRDEVNHMTKFWGFGLWAYPDSSILKVVKTLVGAALGKLCRRQPSQASLIHTLRRMAQVLHWSAWSWGNKLTFTWTFMVVLLRLWRWSWSLTPAYLKSLLGTQISGEYRS